MLTVTDLNNQYFEVIGLIDGTTQSAPVPPGPTYINNATGTVEIVDAFGTAQVIGPNGQTVASLVYVPNSNGMYQALITNAFDPAPGVNYWAVVDLVSPNGGIGHWEIPLKVAVRRR